MLYLILLILIAFLIYDFLKDKIIVSPPKVFNLIWFIVLFLYSLKLSYIQLDFSNKTLFIFFMAILFFNITYIVLTKINIKLKDHTFLNFDRKKMLNIFTGIFIIVFLLEIIYSGGFPLLWKLFKIPKNYLDFGIPSVHGALNGLAICLGAYYIFQPKEKRKYLFLCYGILIISRQVLISLILQATVFNILQTYQKHKRINIKKYFIIGVIGFILFTIIGNFRSGNVMNEVFQPRDPYQNLPVSIKWMYSYVEFSFSNFENLVRLTPGGVNKGANHLRSFLPTILEKKFYVSLNFDKSFLVSPAFTVSTYLPEIYLDFGTVGICIFHIIIAFLMYLFYRKTLLYKRVKYILIYGVLVHNTLLLFFNNMFIYLPILIEYFYIYMIFDNLEEKKILKKVKNQNKLISIIVPVYNVKQYIKKCVNSILKQSYSNIEILLIDDGSTDGSAKICDDLMKKDKRIKTYHKKNGGLSDARNYGIDKAKGEYYCFIDSDDYIEDTMIEKLLWSCLYFHVEISWCDKYIELDNGKKYLKQISMQEELFCPKEMFKRILLNDTSVCDKMFHKNLFKDVKFPKGKLFEDIVTLNYLVERSSGVYYINEPLYHYLQREDSIVHNNFNIKKLDYVRHAKQFSQYVVEKYSDLKQEADAYYILVLNTVLTELYFYKLTYSDEYYQCLEEFRNLYKANYFNAYIPLLKKIMCVFTYYDMTGIVCFAKKIKKLLQYSN